MKAEATAVMQMREDGDLDAGLLCAVVLFSYCTPVAAPFSQTAM